MNWNQLCKCVSGWLAAVMVMLPVLTAPPPAKGMWRDAETGMYYFRGRYYQPPLGRFAQRDPNGQALIYAAMRSQAQTASAFASFNARGQFINGPNLYQFCGSNPINRTDPTGMFSLAELSASSGIEQDMEGNYMSFGASVVDSMKGVALMANERNAQLDLLLGTSTNPFDWTTLDQMTIGYEAMQKFMLGTFFISVGGKALSGAVGIGKRAWSYFSENAGGRAALLETMEKGASGQQQLFHFMDEEVALTSLSQPSSRKLAENLNSAGISRPLGSAAHHIVAGADQRAALARIKLQSVGIDINDAANGVFLPAQAGSMATGVYHPSMHTSAYYQELNSRLQNVNSRNEVLLVLDQIATELRSGTFPY